MENDAPKSSLFHKIYRGFIVVLLLAALVFGYITWRVNGQRKLVKWTQDNGGNVTYAIELDDEGRFLTIDDIKKQKSNGWLLDYIGMDYVSKIAKLSLPDGVTDFSEIEKLTDLRELTIGKSTLDDISFVAKMKDLEELSFEGNPVADLSPVAELSKLRFLNVSDTKITDISPVSGLTELARLYVNNTEVEDFTSVENLPKLRDLKVENSKLANLDSIGKVNSLQRLYVGGCNFSDVSPLANCENLKYIFMDSSGVTDILPLKDCKVIETLSVIGTKVPQENVDALKAAKPGLKVTTEKFVYGR